jgi:hypothetical protein
MTRFGEVLEGSLSALRHRLEGVSAGDGEAVRSEVGAMAQRVQEQMNRLEASVHELRDRPAFAPPAPEPEVAAEPAVTMQPVEEAAPPAPPEPEPPDESGAAEEASGTLESPAGTEVEETSDADGRGETGEDEPAPEEELPPPPPPAEVAEPAEPVEPAEGEEPDPGSKKLPDIWSWGPKQS